MEILPAILTEDAETFRDRFLFPGLWQPGMTAHVDILDGTMFNAACFCDPAAIARHSAPHISNTLPSIELHCMVRNPIPIIEQWKAMIPETARAIVHAEIDRPIDDLLHRIRALELECGVALCPETATTIIETLPDLVDRVLVMGIEPGASGRPFLGEPILAKIRRLRALFPSLHLSLDGGVTKENIRGMHDAGASSVIAGSAVWATHDPVSSYEHLVHAVSSRNMEHLL